MGRTAAILAAAAFLSACGGARAPRPDESDVEHVVIDVPRQGTYRLELEREREATVVFLPGEVEELFGRLARALPRLGLAPEQLTTYDAAAYRVTFRNARVRTLAERPLSDFLRCGYSPTTRRANQGQVTITVDAWLEPAETGATLFVQFYGMARDRGQSSSLTPCTSRGTFEALLAEEVVAGRAATP